jgi:heme exporter protein C
MVLCHQRPHAAVAGRRRAAAAGRHHLGPGLRPPDYQQGNSFRIIYIHVPAAMLAQSCYVMLAVAGVVGLVWKMKLADVALQCAAPIGAWMTAVALVTGAIWGKPTWGSGGCGMRA